MNTIFHLILILLALGAIVFWAYGLFRSLRSSVAKDRSNGMRSFRALALALILAVVPVILILTVNIGIGPISNQYDFLFAGLLAFLISGVWVMYVRQLDIYEQDPWWALVLTFILSCSTIWFVAPISNLFQSSGWHLGQGMVSDLFYCIVVIGGVEEFVKILPVLLLLRSSKMLNEPFDYILYGSVSALGFAFIENTMYLERSELLAINARTFMASVAHMTFTSLICYGMMLHRFALKKPCIPVVAFFALGSISHGIYDFWLIHPFLYNMSWLTVLFFIITVHIWFIMKNNAINMSNFYSPEIHFVNARMKRRLLLSLLGLLAVGSFFITIRHGRPVAQRFFAGEFWNYGFIAIYLVFSIDKFKVVKGFLAPMNVPFRILFPKAEEHHQMTGLRLEISSLFASGSKRHALLSSLLPVEGVVMRRAMLEKDNEPWFVLKLDERMSAKGVDAERLVFRPSEKSTDPYEDHAPVKVALVRSTADPLAVEFKNEDLMQVGNFFSTPLSGFRPDQHQ